MDAEANRCSAQVEGKEGTLGEGSGKELVEVRREGLSLVEICVTFPCAHSRGGGGGARGRERGREEGEPEWRKDAKNKFQGVRAECNSLE